MEAPDVADLDDDQDTTELMQFYFHTDSLGSVTHLSDPSENVVEKYEYTPYGKTTIRNGTGNDLSGQSAVGNPWMYTGRRLDEETGLVFLPGPKLWPESQADFFSEIPSASLGESTCTSMQIRTLVATQTPWAWLRPVTRKGMVLSGMVGLRLSSEAPCRLHHPVLDHPLDVVAGVGSGGSCWRARWRPRRPRS
jgi:hypothetical protein